MTTIRKEPVQMVIAKSKEGRLVKYCLVLADRVTESRCNKCWGEGAGDCSWHHKCKEDNLVDGVHIDDWEKSEGCKIEIQAAEETDVPVVDQECNP